jgi:7-cyano-7-deazaguanine synthase
MKSKKQAVLSLSGGLDSSTVLLHLLEKGYEVTALSFNYGQKHKVELERAKELVNYLNLRMFEDPKCTFKSVKHQIIKLDGLSSLLNSTLVEGGSEVPEGHYENENMVKTVVPNRNKIFSSIIQSVALSLATKGEIVRNVKIAMGIHAGDFAVYPDCREEFRNADHKAFEEGNWHSEFVSMYTPYIDVTKLEILQDGQKCCSKLGLDFNEVYSKTNTSYKPIKIGDQWYSDYKSASSVERIEAFIGLGVDDPVQYADQTGPVSWELAKQAVLKVLEENGKVSLVLN